MARIFRKLSRKRYWDRESWLGAGEVKSDATKCLMTEESSLSVYVLEDPGVQEERVVAALALTRDNLKHFDLALVPENILDACEIQRCYVLGETPDPEVNEWHCNLVRLTVTKIARLAAAIHSNRAVIRYQRKHVEAAIRRSLSTSPIISTQIKSSLIPSLEKRGIHVPQEI